MKIRRKFNHWIPQLLNVHAITLYPFILFAQTALKVKNDRNLYKHEWVHIEQYRNLGVLNFVVQYLWQQARVGYKNNKFEKEAYGRQHEDFTGEEMNAWQEDMN